MARSRKQADKLSAETDGSTKVTRTPSPSPSRLQSPPSPESERPTGPLSLVLSSADRDVVKVNNANATELKNACDDAVKRCLARPELFKQNHLHTDVRLALGWLSVFVAGGTALYGYKIDFEQSKPVVSIGLVVYILLTVAQTIYAFFIEGSTIFVGKRKTFSKRILSERIHINSTTVTSPPNLISNTVSQANAPLYNLNISYVRSTNRGKSLLAKGRVTGAQPYSVWFDEQGTMDQEALERWVGEQVEQAMDGKMS